MMPPTVPPTVPRWVLVAGALVLVGGALYLVTRAPSARRRRNGARRRRNGAAEELGEHRGRVQTARKAAAALCRSERREVDEHARAELRAARARGERRKAAAARRCRIRSSALTREAKYQAHELRRRAKKEARADRRAAEETGAVAMAASRRRTAPIVDPWTGKPMRRERIELLQDEARSAADDTSHPGAARWWLAQPGNLRDVVARTAASYRRRGAGFLAAHQSLDVASAVVEGFEENREDLLAQWAEAEEARDHSREGAAHYRQVEKERAAELRRGAAALAGDALPALDAERRIVAALRVRGHAPKVARGRVRCARCGAAGKLDRTRRGSVSLDAPDALRADCAGEEAPF